MNSEIINLNTSSTTISTTLAEQLLYDLTNVTFTLSGISEQQIPTKVKINWGDGSEVLIANNSFLKDYRKDSIFPEVLYNKFSTVLGKQYTHLYYPSTAARFKALSAQVVIEYFNGDKTSIVQPLKILSEDYYESIEDLKHLHTNILPVSGNNKQFIFSTLKDGFLVESET
jgi:hypothetical protein